MVRPALALLAAALLAPTEALPQAGAPPATPAAPPASEPIGQFPPPRAIPDPKPGAGDQAGVKAKGGKDAKPPRPLPRASVLEEVVGTVKEVDRVHHRLTIDGAAGPVTLTVDRNTLVYGPAGLTTVLDVIPGASVRAGRNADDLAYWVTVRGPQRTPSTPAQGTGPGGGGPPPAGEGTAPGPATAPPAGPAPGSTSPGPPAPPAGGPGR
ncbi:hypothetical protein [Anaeromyxobacter dehalogenans]|uniref:hypothetical protein n=1 Tax=Anaeromyxobacter dehalogenans TaxID=161493 RepID=UPI0002F9B629|nr:hypothetical protein [Anaeromyxobacter dehalogenans]